MLKILSIFNKRKFSQENQKAAEDSIKSLRDRMNTLNQKAFNLSENYPQQRKEIEECNNILNSIEPSSSVRAGKFEQQIAVAITKVSTVLNSEIKLLTRAIRERQNADITVQEE